MSGEQGLPECCFDCKYYSGSTSEYCFLMGEWVGDSPTEARDEFCPLNPK
jgi:hypothetical protein